MMSAESRIYVVVQQSVGGYQWLHRAYTSEVEALRMVNQLAEANDDPEYVYFVKRLVLEAA
jgi:hypothetical protein